MTKFTRPLYTEVLLDGEYVELEFKAHGAAEPGDPGKCYGPPENCYPPEPACVEWVTITCLKTSRVFTADEFELLVRLGGDERYTLEEAEEISLLEELFGEPDDCGDYDDRGYDEIEM